MISAAGGGDSAVSSQCSAERVVLEWRTEVSSRYYFRLVFRPDGGAVWSRPVVFCFFVFSVMKASSGEKGGEYLKGLSSYRTPPSCSLLAGRLPMAMVGLRSERRQCETWRWAVRCGAPSLELVRCGLVGHLRSAVGAETSRHPKVMAELTVANGYGSNQRRRGSCMDDMVCGY